MRPQSVDVAVAVASAQTGHVNASSLWCRKVKTIAMIDLPADFASAGGRLPIQSY